MVKSTGYSHTQKEEEACACKEMWTLKQDWWELEVSLSQWISTGVCLRMICIERRLPKKMRNHENSVEKTKKCCHTHWNHYQLIGKKKKERKPCGPAKIL